MFVSYMYVCVFMKEKKHYVGVVANRLDTQTTLGSAIVYLPLISTDI